MQDYRLQKKELLNKTWDEITHPDDLKRDVKFIDSLISGKSDTYSIEKRYIRKDGSIIPVEIFVSCVRLESGEIEYFIAMVNDISGRK